MALDGSAAEIAKQPWRGKWCWTQRHQARPWNQYALFRRVFDLAFKPSRAIVRVSADARYTLYVNGRRIHQGPARSFPEYQSYDTLDLADALRAGPNTICAIAHQFGVPTFQHMYRDMSGFILDAELDLAGHIVQLHTPEGWTCAPCTAWRRDVDRISIHLGFQEHFDADAWPANWMEADFAASPATGWNAPKLIGPVGTMPWLRMEQRGVPLLADHVEEFQQVLAQFSGENARGYKISEDVYHLAGLEKRKREKGLIERPHAMLKDDDELTTLPPPPDGEFVMAVLDLGIERTGHLIVDISDAAGDEIIDILYTEDIDKTGAPALVGVDKPTASQEATADRYRCRPGPQRWEAFAYKGFRFATLVFRNLERPLKLRFVGLRQVHAALEEIGRFECSDTRLNQIWRVSRETLRNCMFDAYVDCPWREQAQWWGDAQVEFWVNAYAYGDASLLERGIRQVARSIAADGSLHSHPPCDQSHRLPDYAMTWVSTLWDHYFQTGRTDLLEECYGVMHQVFDFFARHEIKDGLVGGFDRFWVFLDWQQLYKGNFSAVLNLMYLRAIRAAEQICGALDEQESAAKYRRKGQRLAAVLEQYFWDAKALQWREGFDLAANKPVEDYSQHAQALAILLGLKPDTHATLARDVLHRSARKRSKVLTASPFFYAYVLEAMIAAGLREESIQIIRDKWGAMLDAGATTFWEVWDGVGSRCHAWSASPLYHLSQQILGVFPTQPGWRRVRIAPWTHSLDYAKGIVPSPLGAIRVEWETVEDDQLVVRIDLPPGMDGEFINPRGERRPLVGGSNEFSA